MVFFVKDIALLPNKFLNVKFPAHIISIWNQLKCLIILTEKAFIFIPKYHCYPPYQEITKLPWQSGL
jgi:hypothetical protein